MFFKLSKNIAFNEKKMENCNFCYRIYESRKCIHLIACSKTIQDRTLHSDHMHIVCIAEILGYKCDN